LPVPEGQSKGRKRSSCLSCVKLRTRCDQETPCTRCQELGKECIRCTPFSLVVPDLLPTSLSASNVTQPPEPNRPRSREAISIHHLLNTPEGDDFIGRFPIRDAPRGPVADDEDAVLGDQEASSDSSHWSEDHDQHDVFYGADVNFDFFFESFESLTFGAYPMQSEPLPGKTNGSRGTVSAAAVALEPRAYEIRHLLQTTAANFSNLLPEARYMHDLAPAIELLTHDELDHCINLYFANYHRHCPIIHRPSFQPTMVPIPMLLSTVALGGMYSSEQNKVAWMRSLLDVMEAYIFGLPGLRDEYHSGVNLAKAPDEDTLHQQFQLFQGAYLMVVAQFFSGNVAARRRARRQRFMRVLTVCSCQTSCRGRVLKWS